MSTRIEVPTRDDLPKDTPHDTWCHITETDEYFYRRGNQWEQAVYIKRVFSLDEVIGDRLEN